MVSKSFIAYTFLLCFTTSVNAHAFIDPGLGVKGQGSRNDVQNPTDAKPCGNVNIAQTLDTSTALQLSSNGSISPSITDFNGGADGSRKVQSVKVDPSGTGNNFVAATMLVNGDPNPANTATQQLVVQFPAGTKCTGGTSKNLCLVSFVTTAKFGNCVVAQGSNNDAVSTTLCANSKTDSTTPGNNTNGQPQNKATKDNLGTDNLGNTTTGNTTTGNNNTGKTDTGKNKTVSKIATGKNSTDTKTGGKTKCNSANSKANRRSASFKRIWSSRELVNVL